MSRNLLHPTLPCSFVEQTRHRVLCLHVLSSFQRTGVLSDQASNRQVDRAPLRVFLRQGNLAILLTTALPVNPRSNLFRGVATSRPMSLSRKPLGVIEPEGCCGKKICFQKPGANFPATGRVTLGPSNIRASLETVNPRVRRFRPTRPARSAAQLSRRSRFTNIRDSLRPVNLNQFTRSTNARRPTCTVSSPGADGCQCFSLNTSPLMRTPPC